MIYIEDIDLVLSVPHRHRVYRLEVVDPSRQEHAGGDGRIQGQPVAVQDDLGGGEEYT